MLRLNLGAADRHIDGFVSVDRYSAEIQDTLWNKQRYEVVDLAGNDWPWEDSSVDEILAHDIVEHLRRPINTMNEIWRVLKPGARVTIEVPNASRGAGAFQDPTHVSFWTMNSFQYYEDGSFAHQRFAKAYGITARFKIVRIFEVPWQDAYEQTWKITAVLEAVK